MNWEQERERERGGGELCICQKLNKWLRLKTDVQVINRKELMGRRKYELLRIVICGYFQIETRVKSEEPSWVVYFLFLLFLCQVHRKQSKEERKGNQRATNREGQHWCVEVRIWDSDGRTRQCMRERVREIFSPQNLVELSIEFEKNKVQDGWLSSLQKLLNSRLFTPNPRPTKLESANGLIGQLPTFNLPGTLSLSLPGLSLS